MMTTIMMKLNSGDFLCFLPLHRAGLESDAVHPTAVTAATALLTVPPRHAQTASAGAIHVVLSDSDSVVSVHIGIALIRLSTARSGLHLCVD